MGGSGEGGFGGEEMGRGCGEVVGGWGVVGGVGGCGEGGLGSGLGVSVAFPHCSYRAKMAPRGSVERMGNLESRWVSRDPVTP